MPLPTRHLRRLFAINATPTRWPIALKAAIAMALPLAISVWLEQPALGLIANMGGFTVLYGPQQPARFRLRLLLSVAVGLVASATLGALSAPWPWLSVLVLVAMAAGGSFACAALQIGPPGAFSFTLVAGSATNIAHRGVPLHLIVMCIAAGAMLAICVGMADLIRDPYRIERAAIGAASKAVDKLADIDDDDSDEADKLRAKAASALHKAWTTFHDAGGGRSERSADLERDLIQTQAAYVAHHTRRGAKLAGVVNSRSVEALAAENRAMFENESFAEVREAHLGRPPAAYLLRTALRWPSPELVIALRTGIGAALAGATVLILHLGHPYWAIAFCVLMLHQGGTRVAMTVRSVQRFLGTVAGLGVFALLSLLHPQGWILVAMIFALQFTIEELVTRNYGLAVIFMTPLAVFLASAATPDRVPQTVHDRLIDTLICSLAAIVTIWAVGNSRTSLMLLRAQLVRDAEAISSVLRDRAEGGQTHSMLARRQFLHYELVNTTGVETLARGDDPEAATPWEAVAASMWDLGMQVLGMCWYPARIGERETYLDARDRLRTVIGEIRHVGPGQVDKDLDRVSRKLLTAGAQDA